MKTAGYLANDTAAAYVRKEINLVRVKKNARCTAALVFPNRYCVGMSNLGMHTLYELLNRRPEIRCERFFFEPRKKELLGLESGRPLAAFDIVAFSVAYEPDYLNVAAILAHAGLRAAWRRRTTMPLILSGGAVTYSNVRPLAGISDIVVCGEGEPVLPQCLDLILEAAPLTSLRKKEALLDAVAAIPGIVVPGVTRADPQPLPAADIHAFNTVSRLITPLAEFRSTYLVELSRGCPRGCAFCVAGAAFGAYRPRRWENLIPALIEGLAYTRNIGLVAAAVSDYPQLPELCDWLRARQAAVSVSSLRVETVTRHLLEALVAGGQQTVTFAPEAGSESLRRRLRKDISDAAILEKIELARQCGIRRVKLYFMLGLPEETDADARAIAGFLRRAAAILPVRAAVGIFVPKPRTPFAAVPLASFKTVRVRTRALLHAVRAEPEITLTFARYPEAKLDWEFSQGGEGVILEGRCAG
ncbi:MAG: B12-binding domain-containing radical SAM protein [Candidatus Omnitrophica bacterium]|nr:B12-binding domain-containing radical SAM protein [Candidatus Omnitrophota bacterium]